jgi:hypothetical protein
MLKLKLIATEFKKPDPRTQSRIRPCNLCGERFKAPTAHCCFCVDCKRHHELYRFHDWLPDELAVA